MNKQSEYLRFNLSDKLLDGGHGDGRACTDRHMDIGQGNRHEQEARQGGLRMAAGFLELPEAAEKSVAYHGFN